MSSAAQESKNQFDAASWCLCQKTFAFFWSIAKEGLRAWVKYVLVICIFDQKTAHARSWGSRYFTILQWRSIY
jgi:hypothetical protein